MRRSGPRCLLLVALAVLLSACRSSVAAISVPVSTPPAIAGITPAVTTTAQPTLTPISLAAGTGSVTARSEGVGLAQRPLRLPDLAPGASCPVTGSQPADTLDPGDFKASWSYFAFGPGPVYPIIYQFDPTGRSVRPSHDQVSGWTFDKVLWLIAPRYSGRALVRARRLDPPVGLTFFHGRAGSQGQTAALQISTPHNAVGWQTFGSAVRFASPVPGCYAFQVDGSSFSDVIVFQVVA